MKPPLSTQKSPPAADTAGRLHALNLSRMLQLANERTRDALGPLPSGGMPVRIKRPITLPPKVMPAPPAAGLSSTCQRRHAPDVAHVPLPEVSWAFDHHSFGAYSYNTLGCTVLYADRYQGIAYAQSEVAPPPQRPDIETSWAAHHSGIDNFPAPALVTWRSLDGAAHQAQVDIGAIFKQQQVLHDVPTEKLSVLASQGGGRPSIILVVDDRTISVYMKAFVSLKEPESSGNGHGSARDAPVLAYRCTY